MVMNPVPEIDRVVAEIPGRVKDCRIKAGLSQVILGKEIGVSQTIIQRIESGEADLDIERAFKIAYVTGQRVSYIMGQTNELTQNPTFRHLHFRRAGDWCSGNTGDSGLESIENPNCDACVWCQDCANNLPSEFSKSPDTEPRNLLSKST